MGRQLGARRVLDAAAQRTLDAVAASGPSALDRQVAGVVGTALAVMFGLLALWRRLRLPL